MSNFQGEMDLVAIETERSFRPESTTHCNISSTPTSIVLDELEPMLNRELIQRRIPYFSKTDEVANDKHFIKEKERDARQPSSKHGVCGRASTDKSEYDNRTIKASIMTSAALAPLSPMTLNEKFTKKLSRAKMVDRYLFADNGIDGDRRFELTGGEDKNSRKKLLMTGVSNSDADTNAYTTQETVLLTEEEIEV